MKVYGPYTRDDGRKHVIIYDNGIRTTVSYPKFLMEQHLGRKLESWETVDHIDEDFTNDVIENLQILSRTENILKSKAPEEIIEFTCSYCGEKATKKARNVRHNKKKGSAGPFCGRSCAGKWSVEQDKKRKREILKAAGLL
jgi:hypothetical protein